MLAIAPLDAPDVLELVTAFAAIGWDKPEALFERYGDEAHVDARVTLVAKLNGAVAGYGTLLWQPAYQPFQQAGTPEIADLNVLPQFRRRGIGSALLGELEALAARRSPLVGLGVGLTEEYGPAQRLYVSRGYVPDGRGAQASGETLRWGARIVADDSLVLHLTKMLKT